MFDLAPQACGYAPIHLGARPLPRDGPAIDDRRTAWFGLMLDEIDYGVLLLDAELCLRHSNLAARRELDATHPLACVGRTLLARAARDAPAFDQALRGAIGRGLRRLLLLGDAGQRVAVAVVPLLAPGDGRPSAVQVSLGKRQVCGVLSVQWFARDHGLTGTETRVLEALCDGAAPSEIAERHGVGIATVRSQIGSIRAKTRCTSIGALVRQVAVLPPLVDMLRGDGCGAPAQRAA
jgi:DNA-binding CsgD family transcriptional regulator